MTMQGFLFYIFFGSVKDLSLESSSFYLNDSQDPRVDKSASIPLIIFAYSSSASIPIGSCE